MSRVDEQFGIVPLWLLESGASDGAIRLYAYIAAKYADGGSGSCYPGVQTLASALNRSDSWVKEKLAELRSRGAVDRKRRPNTSTLTLIHRTRPDSQESGRPDDANSQKSGSPNSQESGPKPDPVEPDPVNSPANDSSFDAFWESYPNRKGRRKAEELWSSLAPADRAAAIAGAAEFAASADYAGTVAENERLGRPKHKYVLHGDQFLKHRRWEDEFSPAEQTIDTGGWAQ